MPDARGNQQVIAVVMVVSALTLAVVAALIYGGTVPLPEETRLVAAVVVGVAAFADFLVGLWFFRKGLSS